MAPKRKKEVAVKGSVADTQEQPPKNEASSSLATLLEQIEMLSQSKTRCSEALQDFVDWEQATSHSASTPGTTAGAATMKQDGHVDCYWILIATHLLNRMLVYHHHHPHHQSEDHELAMVMAKLSHDLAKTLLTDKSKFERSANASQNVKSVLGRAIVTVSVAAITSLQQLVTSASSSKTTPHSSSSELLRKALWNALFALDMVVHYSTQLKHTLDGWNSAAHHLSEDASELSLTVQCQEVQRQLNISPEEEGCITTLLTISSTNNSATATTNSKRSARARRSHSEKPMSAMFYHTLQPVLDTVPTNTMALEGRVSIRRWASMAFVWLCQGQQCALDICHTLLSDGLEHWNTILDCPARVPSSDHSPKRKSSRKRNSADSMDATTTITTMTTGSGIAVPGNVARVAFVARLLEILSESGNHCGARPPTGGMDTYVASIWNANQHHPATGESNRPDVRSTATVVIYKLLQAHFDALLRNIGSPRARKIIVNDETDGPGAPVHGGVARFYPGVHKTIDILCRSAAASSTQSTVADSTRRLLGVATAFVFASSYPVFDAKLTNFAVSQLTESLRNILNDDETNRVSSESEDENAVDHPEIVKEYRLGDPLPIPTLLKSPPAKSTTRKKKSTDSAQQPSVCTYGGVFIEQTSDDRLSDDEFLSICIRAMVLKGPSPTSEVLGLLIEAVRCCYDPPSVAKMKTEDDNPKRAARGSAGKKKRRKLSIEGNEDVVVDPTTTESKVGVTTTRRLNSVRAGLATDAMNALRMFLKHTPMNSSASPARRRLRQYARECLTTDQLCQIVALNDTLTRVMTRKRASGSAKRGLEDAASPGFFSNTTSIDYRHFERLLWSAHINLCLTLGRGQTSYDPRKQSTVKQPVLGDAVRRLTVFQAVAKASVRNTSFEENAALSERWPLALPAAQHALVTSNLASELISSDIEQTSPERFIVTSFISTIADALTNLSHITSTTWYRFSQTEDEEPVIDDDVPLSLRDARLLVLAVSRLSADEQMVRTSEFIEMIFTSLNSIKSDAGRRTLIESNPAVSGFIARVVTVCATLVNVVTVGPSLRDALVLNIGPTQYQIRNLVRKSDIIPKMHEEADWYARETSFMGLFSDWESPTVPDVSLPTVVKRLDDTTFNRLNSLLESALSLGFRSARCDKCHLLFAAWNASGRRESWTQGGQSREMLGLQSDSCSNPQILIRLRDEVCEVHRMLHQNADTPPDSLLSSLLQQRAEGSRSASQLKQKFEAMMTHAEKLVETMLTGTVCAEDEFTLEKFSLLEALSAYVAFIVAEHTTTSNDFFPAPTANLTRRRRNRVNNGARGVGDDEILAPILSDEDSAESEGGYDYNESHDERQIGALARLHDACNIFGAAPIHPDWLDETCRLRDSITSIDGQKMAQRALKLLSDLASFAVLMSNKCILQALSTVSGDGTDGKSRALLAIRLSNAGLHLTSTGEELDRQRWYRDVAEVCQINSSETKLLSMNRTCKNATAAKEAWCPNAAQRVVGRLQDQSVTIEGWEASYCEYRAGGEWELLVSDALLGSCLDVDADLVLSTENHVCAQRWRRVYEASVSNLMPATALLRFCLGGGIGRGRHPLANNSSIDMDDQSAVALMFHERLPTQGLQVDMQCSVDEVEITHKCLAALAHVAVSTRHDSPLKKACHAAASNLAVDSNFLSDLEATLVLREAFLSLLELRGLFAGNNHLSSTSSTTYLVNGIFEIIEAQGGAFSSDSHVDDSISPIDKIPEISRLLAFICGSDFEQDTIVKNHAKHLDILSLLNWSLVDDSGSEQAWQWRRRQDGLVSEMIEILCDVVWDMNEKTRRRLTHILSSLAELENDRMMSTASRKIVSDTSFLVSVTQALNSLGEKHFRNMVNYLCCAQPAKQADVQMAMQTCKNVCILLVCVVGVTGANNPDKSLDFVGGRFILDTLMQNMEQWAYRASESSECVMALIFLLGSRFDALGTIGTKLFGLTKYLRLLQRGEHDSGLHAIECFFRFVRDLAEALTEIKDDQVKPGRHDSSYAKVKGMPSMTSSNHGSCIPHAREISASSTAPESSKTGHSFVPRACSFVLRSGFHAQHWYNCYTCGLVWDKGCCSLCALLCHRGHDVAYSRHSSFFCDCGAEVANADEQNRIACKCLSLLSREDASKLFVEETSLDLFALPNADRHEAVMQKETALMHGHNAENEVYKVALDVAVTTIKPQASLALAELKKDALGSCWINDIFELVRLQYDAWHARGMQVLLPTANARMFDIPLSEERYQASEQYFLRNLRCRSGNQLELLQLPYKPLWPIRGAKAGAFNLKLSVDSTTDRLKRALLTKNQVTRAAIVADSRGRLIVAEPNTLVFCSALASVNVTYEKKPQETPCGRGQMYITGTASVKFNIVGMQLCRDNERHLVIWGTTEAMVAILSPLCDRVERTIDLTVDLEPQESEADYVLKCEWLPGSQTIVAIACGSFVKLYDIKRVEMDSRAIPLTCCSLAYEALIRDIAFLPMSVIESKLPTNNIGRSALESEKVKLVMLLDNGRLHAIDFNIDRNDELLDNRETYVGSGDSIEFSAKGIRSHSGTQATTTDARLRSLGEGSTLVYLPKSGVLVYQCVSSCVVGMFFDDKGKISESFELLPNIVEADVLGTGSDGYNITGPYTHWTELGVVEDAGTSFFSLVCVGKSSRTNQPKMLYLSINESSVRVKEITWSVGGSMALGLSMSSAFEGLAAFSAPAPLNDDSAIGGSYDRSFFERSFLCAVTSNGSMLFFGENLRGYFSDLAPSQAEISGASPARRRAMSESALGRNEIAPGVVESTSSSTTPQPSFPLTIFEKLIHVSDSVELSFGGDGVGSERHSARTKLSAKNSLYLMCSSREGCTITAALHRDYSSSEESYGTTKRTHESRKQHNAMAQSCILTTVQDRLREDELVIVAVRLLVGSTTTEYIPTHVYVQGRRVGLTQGLKRWYDLPLTAEEIALGMRNGFVSIGIGPSFDPGNNPLVDALEVYAKERKFVDHWLPKGLGGSMTLTPETEDSPIEHNIERIEQDELVVSTSALSHLLHIIGSQSGHSIIKDKTLMRIIEASALDGEGELRRCVNRLLCQVESDADVRQGLIDEGTILGASRMIHKAEELFDDKCWFERETKPLDEVMSREFVCSRPRWTDVIVILKDCLTSSASIATLRPRNYIESNEKLMAHQHSIASLAVSAIKFILRAKVKNFRCETLVSSAIELCLTEAACRYSSTLNRQLNFAAFSDVSKLLESEDIELMRRCCDAISSYVENTSSLTARESGPGSWKRVGSEKTNPSAPIAYQCDSCSLFPINGSRYTLLEGDYDIDLCEVCYQIGHNYACHKGYNEQIEVKIRGRSVGDYVKLTCEQISHMQAVPVGGPDIFGTSSIDGSERGDDGALSLAVKLSKQEVNDDIRCMEVDQSDQHSHGNFNRQEFTAKLFADLLELLTASLTEDNAESKASQVGFLVQLLLRMIKNCPAEDIQLHRVKQFTMAIASQISNHLTITQRDKVGEPHRSILILCLRALSSLLQSTTDELASNVALSNADDCSFDEAIPGKAREKEDLKFLCDIHAVPAVRRKCSHGAHKNRRFYVCGMERNSRCRYFKWADADDIGTESANVDAHKSRFRVAVESFMWDLFSQSSDADSRPLHAQLCQFLELDAHAKDSVSAIASSFTIESKAPSSTSDVGGETANSKSSLDSMYGRTAAIIDFADGVFCSQEKLRGRTSRSLLVETNLVDSKDFNSTDYWAIATRTDDSVLDASLELLSHMAGSAGEDVERHGSSRWYSLLCEIISSNALHRGQAKRALKRLCGGKKALYHSVRDHYVFGFQFRMLLRDAQGLLRAALNVKEQARQCGVRWKTSERVKWSTLPAGGLIGTQNLVSEDCLTVSNRNKIGATLDELANVAKSRGENWRNFCGLASLPHSHREQNVAFGDIGLFASDITVKTDDGLFHAPPIVSLMWIACVLSGSNQVKAMKLIDVALSNSNEKHGPVDMGPTGTKKTDASSFTHSGEEVADFMTSDGVYDAHDGSRKGCSSADGANKFNPEHTLLRGPRALIVEEVHAFVVQFVLGGSNHELRKVAYHVAVKICRKLELTDFEWIFMRLVDCVLRDVSLLGSTCVQTLQLLQSLVKCVSSSSKLQLAAVAKPIIHGFTDQMKSLKRISSGNADSVVVLEFPVKGGETIKKRLDFARCTHCHRLNTSKIKTSPGAPRRQPSQEVRGSQWTPLLTRRGDNALETSGRNPTSRTESVSWLPEQVRPFARGRLEASMDASVSTEFATYSKLKCRLAISDIHVTVSDPRGRFVKTVAVHFSPRPVSDINRLKSEDYSGTWQKCATLTLSRGAVRASCSLSEPVLAANLRFEYIEFYERPGGSRSADGGLLLHCPRCTRVVNNAHGVCGNCGEVAFQCRKCRHINYDRLDAFLCVECGYCASGSFTYELTAGVASNAVAIVDDSSYERTVKVLGIATKLHGELRCELDERIRSTTKKRGLQDDVGILATMHSPCLKRAYNGDLPRSGIVKGDNRAAGSDLSGHGSAVVSIPRLSDPSNRSSASNRARSLLRLARQLRNESSSERSRSGEFLVRQAFFGSSGRGLSIDDIDEADSDVIRLINSSEGASILSSDFSDPLSRLVASIQGRVRESNSREGRGDDGQPRGLPSEADNVRNNSGQDRSNGDNSWKSAVEECEKLYQLMREAERECFELQRRMDAWNRLESDCLAELRYPAPGSILFSPTQCSKCSGHVTLHLLILVMRLFEVDMEQMESSITRGFIRALFEEPPKIDKDLFDLKRLAITTLASRSERGSKMILDELRARLSATRDVSCAEILGKLLDGDLNVNNEFVMLATEAFEEH